MPKRCTTDSWISIAPPPHAALPCARPTRTLARFSYAMCKLCALPGSLCRPPPASARDASSSSHQLHLHCCGSGSRSRGSQTSLSPTPGKLTVLLLQPGPKCIEATSVKGRLIRPILLGSMGCRGAILPFYRLMHANGWQHFSTALKLEQIGQTFAPKAGSLFCPRVVMLPHPLTFASYPF